MRLFVSALVLAAVVIATFLAFGGSFEAELTPAGAAERLRSAGPWGGALVVLLLVSDLVLPIPATPLMSAAGFVYGPIEGGALAALGSVASGLLAWTLCRRLGPRTAERLVGARDLDRSRRAFERAGPWLVACSRWAPVLPEVVACLAGLTKMPPRVFVPALLAGSVPMGFAYAAIGAAGRDDPTLAILISIGLPAVFLVATRSYERRAGANERSGGVARDDAGSARGPNDA
ncbi:MAG: VTT domain-containing protein [Planctomycetota bacterium]